MSPEALLRQKGIALKSFAPGRYYTPCPQCSRLRAKHRNAKVLGVTIEADGSVNWGCNHCGWTGPQKGDGDGADGSQLTAYVYRSADGVALFRKLRNSPGREPRFWLERSDGNGGWKKGTRGVDTAILYRLDEVRKAIVAGREILCAEGEKDVDNLWRIGFAATCDAHGASEMGKAPKWKKKHSEQLAGAAIVVLNDNDSAGYAHADATCALSVGLARRIRRLDFKPYWPDIPKGGDVSDWLAQGHGRKELAALIDGAPDYAPTETTQDEGKTDNGEASDDAQIERLAKLPLMAYDRERKAAAQALHLRASLLDKVVAAKRSELELDGQEDGKPGRPITFDEIELWLEPVGGAELLTDISDVIGSYIIMDERQRDAVALWAAHTHAHNLRDTSPPLVIKSATMRSGKTKLVEGLERLVPRPLFVSGITVSFLERAIEAHRPTLLIDEYDALTSNDPALAEAARAQLNRSAKRRGARVGKNVPLPGGGYEARLFSTWAPTVIAGIGEPPSTVRDRAVVIELKRKLSSEKVRPLRERDGADLAILRSEIARFVRDNEEPLRNADPVALAVDNDRAKDMWDPLLAFADVAGGDWPERARRAGRALADEQESATAEADVRLILLADIRDIFAMEPAPPPADMPDPDMLEPSAALGGRPDDGPRISSKRLLERLHGLEERPWSAWGRAKKPITGKSLGDLLRPYGVRSGTVRTDDAAGNHGTAKGYYLRAFDDTFARYLPTSGFQSVTHNTNPGNQGESEDFAKVTNEVCNGLENAENASKSGVCNGVTFQKGGVWANARTRPSTTTQTPAANHTPSGVIIAAAREKGAVFVLASDHALFTLEWRGADDPLIEAAIRANYEAVLDLLRREAGR